MDHEDREINDPTCHLHKGDSEMDGAEGEERRNQGSRDGEKTEEGDNQEVGDHSQC